MLDANTVEKQLADTQTSKASVPVKYNDQQQISGTQSYKNKINLGFKI